ncbi:MAG: LacI family DNA-binding transcriptional regulator [Candidatus Pedobacter colombiensis]|uniref:LacI family DNA-binding transcriptional regulator n=1 Tax=Candidatus Pedobacter colombiensis TaxID=3121371 RepID=A0AAJ5W814_9SPHI|nr:LacI family DNA-binding transcriptional regulator [Pedobacter sp.]WEK20288.1 MAG: LacI family DNA-binding transcriptional regulator [Pedobacter sp.]
MFEPPTLKDIANALGLSTSTVSRALRDTYEISAKTKKLVFDYAEKINYQPNPNALSLKERRTKSIGVVVSEVANHYFSQAINGIESIAYDRGYHVIITQTHESYAREKINIQHLASRSIDGLLISLSAETSDTAHLKYLHERGMPMVFFDRVPNDIHTHKITANNELGAFDATAHLLKSGYKKIAHLTSSEHLSISIERLRGYTTALNKYGINVNPDYIKHCPHGGMFPEETEQAVLELINLKDKPDAIFIAGDRLSIGCLEVLKKLNIKVPEQIALAGFSNSDVLNLFEYPISSVRQPAFEMGEAATEMLLQLIESKYPITEFENRVIDTELFTRN